MITHPPSERRRLYVVAALMTIAVGLLVHRGPLPLSPQVRDVLGDALWASMMVWWMGAILPASTPRTHGALAFAVCVAVECAQLVHAPWLDAVRATALGHLVLGSGFDPRDLLAYFVGAGAAMLADASW